jgi:hypothetical protein
MDCKKKREMRKVERTRTKNNAIMLTGRCNVCNRKINLLMGRKISSEDN